MPTPKRTRAPDPEAWQRWLERHLKRLDAMGYAATTIAARRESINRFIRYVVEAGVRHPGAVTSSILRAYLIYRRETPNGFGRKDRPRTLNLHFLALRRFLHFLAMEGAISGRLVEAVEYVKCPDSLPKDIPTDAEVRRILAAPDTGRTTGFRDRTILELLYSTGMRRQELVDLKMTDVDFDLKYVRIECGKGGKGRIVPLGRIAAHWIQRYLLVVRPELVRGKADGSWLFVTKSGGKMDGGTVLQTVVKAKILAKVDKNITPHALRRACATEMIRRNANPYHVKELLGHKDFSSLDVYARLTIVDLKEAHRKYHPREQEDEGAASAAAVKR